MENMEKGHDAKMQEMKSMMQKMIGMMDEMMGEETVEKPEVNADMGVPEIMAKRRMMK